ncbi:MAG: alanine:cation symporter family protein, partial [Bacteroidales bacterium]
AAAQTRNPVRQALVTSTGTFWDTVVVCAITGLVIVSSIVAYHDIDYTQGAVLTYAAFDKIPYVGQYVLMISLITFSFSTILGWPYYGEKAVEYLGGDKLIIYYRIMWVIAVFMGSVLNLELVWNIADSMNALMAIPNLISLLLLSGVLVSESRKYLWDNNIDGYDKTPIPKVKDI